MGAPEKLILNVDSSLAEGRVEVEAVLGHRAGQAAAPAAGGRQPKIAGAGEETEVALGGPAQGAGNASRRKTGFKAGVAVQLVVPEVDGVLAQPACDAGAEFPA